MAIRKKTVKYRVDGCACLTGYVNVGDCDDDNVYDMDDNTVAGAVVTPAGDCPQEVVVVCGGEPAPEPPEPIALTGEDCDGAPVEATGLPGQLTHVVQAPGTVFAVKLCEDDRDFELSCGIDPATGHQIQTAYRINAGVFDLINRWDTVTGQEWAGDPATLTGCGGASDTVESDRVEMCDGGTTFLRWIVKVNGEPSGQKFDTDLTGAVYTVTSEANVTPGNCKTSCAQAPRGVLTSWAV